MSCPVSSGPAVDSADSPRSPGRIARQSQALVWSRRDAQCIYERTCLVNPGVNDDDCKPQIMRWTVLTRGALQHDLDLELQHVRQQRVWVAHRYQP